MANKRYNFNTVLKKCNKTYEYDYKLPSGLFDIIITHTVETNIFYVTYSDKQGRRKKSLMDFVYYHVSERMEAKDIRDIILSEENEKLSLKIEIWPPNKIRHAYLYTNYFMKDVGILGKSCMRCKEMQNSLNFYTRNKIKIVVVTDENCKIHARALLWDDVKETRSKKIFTYLDRIYARSDTLLPLFHKLVEENGWRQYKGSSAGNADKGLYKDGLDIKGLCHLPFTDTFRFLYYKDRLVISGTSHTTKIIKYKDDCVSLTNTTNGGYFPSLDPDRTREIFTDNFISKKDAVFIKRYNGYVLKKNIANIKGVYYSFYDKVVIKTTLDGYIIRKDSVNEVITGNTISKTTAIYSADYNGHIHKSNAVIIKDRTYHKNDNNIICFDTKWYHISQCFVQEGILIPRILALIVYNFGEDEVTGELKYKECYLSIDKHMTYLEVLKKSCIKINTGVHILKSPSNKQYLKKFNHKYYIKQDFKLPDKKQLAFNFGE